MNQLERFQKYFKEHEQVIIGFRHGETHGYISKVDEQGIYLIQLKHSKEYHYKWNQCEIIAHAGFLIKKETAPTEALLLKININKSKHGLNSNWFEIYSDSKNNNSLILFNKWKEKNILLKKIPDNEIASLMQKHDPKKYELYRSDYYDLAYSIRTISHHEKVRENKELFFLLNRDDMSYKTDRITWEYRKESDIVMIIRGNYYTAKTILGQYASGSMLGSYCGDIIIGDQYRDRITITNPNPGPGKEWRSIRYNQENIDKIINGIKGDFVSVTHVGDPYAIISGDMIDYKIWKSPQGYMMANINADLYAE